MPAKDFKFISPGIFINEIDNSQLPQAAGDIGPAIIGRAEQGPGLVPTKINSFQEFVEVFGAPNPGNTKSDVSRDGTNDGPTYGAYAAQAWLRNNSPVTFVRLLGQQNSDAETGGEAGWKTDNTDPTADSTQGGAYGLFVFESSSAGITETTGTLAAIWYANTGSVALSGTVFSGSQSPVASSLLITATNAPNVDDTIVITAADGTEKTFKATNAATDGAATIALFNRGGGSHAIDQLKAAIEASSLAGLVTVSAVGGSDPFTITITQNTAGAAGNKGVTNNLTSYTAVGGLNATPDEFDGGEDGDGLVSESTQEAATNKFVKSTGVREFKAVIKGNAGVTRVETKFNFNSTSENFIRKVFNTNPTLTNSTITDSSESGYTDYWLGETFEDEVNRVLTTTGGSNHYGVIIPLFNGAVAGGNFQRDYEDAATGFFISQDLTDNPAGFDAGDQQKLFRLRARNTGRWSSKNLKISIADIRASSDPADAYGSFSVIIRKMDDDDNRIKVLEQFNNCNLNPSSENFIARKIGDKFLEWDDDERRYREYGDFVNNSDYIYVDLHPVVKEDKHAPESLPFGVFGPPTFLPVSASDIGNIKTLVTGGVNFANGTAFTEPGLIVSGGLEYPVKLEFPELRLRVSASEGNPTDPTSVFFGVDTTFNLGRPSHTIGDYTGPKPFGVSMAAAQTTGDAQTKDSFVFTLDDICVDQVDGNLTLSGTLVYVSGSRKNGGGGIVNVRTAEISAGSYREILDLGADRFTTVLHGGFDGLDITEAEPFRNTGLEDATQLTSYAFNSIKVAIDSLRDPEVVEYDLAAIPGLTNNTLNRNLIDMCENRGDALAVVDLKGGYVPETENTQSVQNRVGSVRSTINNKRQNLQINTSFGCAYYPWVQIQDTIKGTLLWAPPSVAAIGAMSYGQRTQELWFAPAGFTRGGLSANNAAGIPVVGLRERLIAKDRDKLYEANINPIAQFPAEGIVIFGQKTLQVTPSALDRINVRRLLIFLKKQISRFAATILFDQNVDVTWQRFVGQVEPFLASVRAGLGLEEYKLILDNTTTTPDLVDRNVVYAKIYLKPARSIEFIAVDFVITDSGASFED